MSKLKNLPLLKPKKKISVLDIAIFVVLIVYFVSLIVPIIWATYSAFNDPDEYFYFYTYNVDQWRFPFPSDLTFNNFSVALIDYVYSARGGYEYTLISMVGNSVLYAFGCAFFYTLTPLIVAYCAARFKFKFSKVIYAFVIITMSLPIVGAMPSEIRMLKAIGLFNNFFGMFVLRMNFLSIYFLIFYAQFEMIPMAYSEAAKVDGASNLKIMTNIILPQAIPTTVTVFLLSFITFWNDYQIPNFYLPSYPTVSLGLFMFTFNHPAEFDAMPIQLAALVGLTIPIIVIFALLNKYLKLNVAAGGIKG